MKDGLRHKIERPHVGHHVLTFADGRGALEGSLLLRIMHLVDTILYLHAIMKASK